MGGLVGFLLGYCVGASDGPERLEKLFRSAQELAKSAELQALGASLLALAEEQLRHLEQSLAQQRSPDATSTAAAWKAIVESAEFRALLATGASFLESLLSTAAPRDDGRAPH